MPSPRPEIQVIQSNYLIRSTADIENNSFQMSAIQKRTFLYIINQINEQENTHNPLGDNWISINPYQMVKAIIPSKPNGNDMNHVWQALSELRGDKYHIIIKYFLDGVLRERRTNLVLEIDRIVTASNEINIHIPDLIHKHTKQLKSNFTKLNLTYSVVLKSFNQIRAYELFSSYSYLGNWTVSINHFRELMEIKPSQYKAFAFLKKQVIDICVSATGDRTNLVVSYEIIREGKKPVEISFSIREKTEEETKKQMIMAALKEEEDKDIQLEISRSRLNKSVEIPNKTVDHVEDKFIILLKSYGVIEPDNYNFSNEIWEQSIRENHNNLKASFIVRTAQELHQKSVYNKKNEEKNKKIEDVINANKKWYEENHRNFNSTISGTTAGAYVMKGTSIVLFKNEKFIEELTPFLR